MSSPRDIILEQKTDDPEDKEPQPVTEAQSDIPAPEQPAPKRRQGRPPGSKNKSTLMREAALRAETPEALPPMTLDVEFTSDQILGEKKRAPKRKAKPPKVKPPEPSSESSDASTVEPVAPPPSNVGSPENTSRDAPRAVRMSKPSIMLPPKLTYLEALTHGINDLAQERSRARSAKYASFFSKLNK